MKLRILGTGGFHNVGLPFNAFVVDGSVLFETPPDIIQSLYREGIPPDVVETVYVSHSHGDHVFGFPFLLYNIWKDHKDDGKNLDVVGPADIRPRAFELASLAIGPDHPYIAWMERNVRFTAIDASAVFSKGDFELSFVPMRHAKETYGAQWRSGGRLRFQYLPDTAWDERFAALLRLECGAIICDVNGEPGQNTVHMSVEDVLEHLPLKPEELKARIIGTHLSREKTSQDSRIEIATPGMELEI